MKDFDFDSRNYNLEFTVMLALGIVSIIVCFALIICSRSDFFNVPEPYQKQLQALEEQDDPEIKALRYKRKVFEMKKEENRIAYEIEKQKRELLRKQFESGIQGKLDINQINLMMQEQISMRSGNVDSNRNLRGPGMSLYNMQTQNTLINLLTSNQTTDTYTEAEQSDIKNQLRRFNQYRQAADQSGSISFQGENN